MASCDMCGRQGDLVTAEVERVEMKVCPNCARFGMIKRKADAAPLLQKKLHKEPAFRVTANYAAVLRQAREKQKLSQEDFARFLQEKESIVAKWEQGRMQPSVEVARQLEKILGVSLVMEDIEQSFEKDKNAKSDGFTLGDFMKVRKKV
ncbi:MAG: multiprotein-bridging factor 1 family protein [Nanoarchaeota archaeon]|nr:multiprotein-bridging factor 1 family protein [Nanoarchaeota archaeon]